MSRSQTITPELRQWISAQAEAGCSAPALLQAMQHAGWDEDLAAEALEQTLRAHPGACQTLDALAQGLPPASPVPEPDLADAPTVIDLADRQVRVLLALGKPRIVVFGELLAPEECDALIEAARPRLARSLTVATATGGQEVNDDRTSEGMFFQRGESPLLRRIEQRIARLVRWPVENGEGLQVLRYRPGAEYKPHYDYFDPDAPGTPTLLARGGQRVGTLVLYLNTPEKGGATGFPGLHLEVSAQRGNAVFFSYERAHPASGSLHGGAPVIAGEKWIATKWLRARKFE